MNAIQKLNAHCFALIHAMRDTNAETMTITQDGVTHKGQKLGDYEIIVRKKVAPAPKKIIREVNEKERKVLEILAEAYHPDEWGAYAFDSLARQTKLELKDVRRACRSLAKKGLAKFEQTLWNDDGPAGAGYRATEEGAAVITPCDVCGKRATYDYRVEDDGTQTMNDDEKTRRVLECEEHYKKSPNLAPKLL